jgi:PIN domain nuclease of toxin-antitoxin system
MRLLLDTHVLLWVMADDPALSPSARATIGAAETVYASSVSIWEVSIKTGLGKLKIDVGLFIRQLKAAGIEPLNVTWSHAETVRHLPDIHRDPFDRLLIAQAVSEPLKLMTSDKLLSRYTELVVTV